MRKLNHILLIDDDTINNFINEKLLKKLNIANKISVALNGEEALNFLKQICVEVNECPELILLDINMPVMDGFEFLEEFEKLPPHVHEHCPIIMLSSSIDPGDQERADNNRFVKKFINKPINKDKVLEL